MQDKYFDELDTQSCAFNQPFTDLLTMAHRHSVDFDARSAIQEGSYGCPQQFGIEGGD
jgi:hypothetical protein